ncbi:hypothetical protein I4U23_024885 [Adineta vaga]|nr:hypothetical protein I4U23_024885 [Adineta vaga]
MRNMKSYFSSWKSFWKSSTNTSHTQTLTLAPSIINFTDTSLGDLKHSVIDEQLMIDISTKLIESVSPPKLQVCAHNNQWFALNNSHLLVYRQLERIGLCDTVVCDIIRSQDVPIGIRQTLTPVGIAQDESNHCLQNSKERTRDPYMLLDDEGNCSQDEIIYCSDVPADSCGCFEDEDPCDTSGATGADSDEDDDDDDDDDNDSDNERSETQRNISLFTKSIINTQFNGVDLDDDGIEDDRKEMQSLL